MELIEIGMVLFCVIESVMVGGLILFRWLWLKEFR